MTVEELLDHFSIYPDEICYYDEQNNIQDTVYIMRITAEGEKEYDEGRYFKFVEEYGKRDIHDWNFGIYNVLDLSF